MTPREKLVEMLSYCRPAGSKAERKFINRYIRPLGVVEDDYGNLLKQVGQSEVMWSCHTDTVHRRPGRQTVKVVDDIASAVGNNCLGADCTTGVWLMIEMIRAGVSGLYIFHRDEEIGGRGSDHIARKTPQLVEGIKYAIAFDRFGLTSVITHQWGGRTCSDAFGRSLIAELGLPMALDDGGTFTDTANYSDLVGECTNISVGYRRQHCDNETQDLAFADLLREQLIRFDESTLVSQRSPGEVEPYDGYLYGSYYNGKDDPLDWQSSRYSDEQTMMEAVVREYPGEAAKLLLEYGVSPDEVMGCYAPRTRRRLLG